MPAEAYVSDASLRALNKDIAKFVKDTGADVVLVQKKLTFDMLSGLIRKTPVDEGVARAGWLVAIGAPSGNVPNVPDTAPAESSPTLTAGMAALSNLPPYQIVYITNNVPYIIVLDQGEYEPPNPDDDALARAVRAQRRDQRQRDRAATELGHPGATWVINGYSRQAPSGMVDLTIAELRGSFQ